MEMSPETIKALLDAFDRSDWREMVVTVGDDRLHVSRDPLPAQAPPPAGSSAGPVADASPKAPGGAAASTPPAPPAPAPPAEEPAEEPPLPVSHDGTTIESPSVGLFWRAPSPGAPPFVEVGGRVEQGETVAIVEVMKLMNHVPSPVSGTVTQILVENGASVEFGQPIVVVEPEG